MRILDGTPLPGDEVWLVRERYPATWARIAARQTFMRQELGIQIKDELLPLSTTPAYLAPLWLAPGRVLTKG